MRFGKIRIEDGNLIFSKHMMLNSLPCKDIIWAYMRREGVEGGQQKQFTTSSLVLITKRRKRYQFDMTDREIQECIQILKALNPDIATGFPKGGRIHLQSLPNTRDLGAIATSDGRHILPKRLIRSGALYHVSLADQDTLLGNYHLTTVIDFRTEAEREQKPDTVMKGVKYYRSPVLDEETTGITCAGNLMDMLTGFDEIPDEFIRKQYETMVRDQICIKQYANFLDVILHQKKGAVLWHCNAGKDRAGVGTALLLYALGVPRKTIKEDFLKSNVYLDTEMQHMIRFLETKMIVDTDIMDKIRLLYKVKGEYLDTVFRTIEKDYGSVELFMKKALYMTPKTIEALRNKYLV